MPQNADLVMAIGTRLQDFTTGSWTNFKRLQISEYKYFRWDATKHLSTPIV